MVEALVHVRGRDILALDVRELTDIADYMVIASGGTKRQVKALLDNLLLKAEEAKIEAIGVEGMDNKEWVLVDFADVIVHVMLPRAREFYELERLWSLDPVKPREGRDLAQD